MLFSEYLDSRQLDQFLQSIRRIIHPGNLRIINSLLSDRALTHERWGHPIRVNIPIHQPCAKVIRKILHHKFKPMVIQYQAIALGAIVQSLPTLSGVLIPLIYRYYNEIKFLDIKMIYDGITHQNQFRLFHAFKKHERFSSKHIVEKRHQLTSILNSLGH
jgi:hypothetical protein